MNSFEKSVCPRCRQETDVQEIYGGLCQECRDNRERRKMEKRKTFNSAKKKESK